MNYSFSICTTFQEPCVLTIISNQQEIKEKKDQRNRPLTTFSLDVLVERSNHLRMLPLTARHDEGANDDSRHELYLVELAGNEMLSLWGDLIFWQ